MASRNLIEYNSFRQNGMNASISFCVTILLSVSLLSFLGCGGGSTDSSNDNGNANSSSSGSGDSGTADNSTTDPSDDNYSFGNLVEMKDAEVPTLEELDAKVEWEEMPVVDTMELRRQEQAKLKPLATPEEALKLKNDSAKNNEIIVSALGILPKSDKEVNWNAELSRSAKGDVKSTNPIMGSSVTEFEVTELISFSLFGFDWNFNPTGSKDTIVKWYSSKDKLYDKVILRDDLTWSDGTPVTAYDVEFSFKTIMTKKVPVPAVRSGTDEIKYIKAYDARTLVFFHKQSLVTNVWNMLFPIIPKHIYEHSIADDPTLQESKKHVALEEQPVSCGPYEFVSRTVGSEIVLKRREGWYMYKGKQVRDKPYYKTIRFKIISDSSVALLALKKATIHESVLTAPQWVTQTNDDDFYKNNTKSYGVEWVNFVFMWNNKVPFFSDKRTRLAMTYAFDHDEMLKELLFGLYEPSTGIFHPDSRWALKPSPKPYLRDIDKAEELLAEAGWEDHDGDGFLDKKIGGKFVKFEFSILVPPIPESIEVCKLLRENLGRIGVVCNIKPTEYSVMQGDLREHKFQAAFSGWGTGADPDTSKNLWTIKAMTEGRNYVNYSNKRVDELFEKGMKEFDIAKREKIYQEIHQILWDDQPYTWLYTRNAMYGFNKSIRGVKYSPRGPYSYGPGFTSLWQPMAN